MASSVWIGQQRYQNINGLDALQAKIAALPEQMAAAVKPALDKGADDFVALTKSIAPVNELDPHPGAMRDSIHKLAGRHDLSVMVVADAKDAQGHEYPAHVEYGHTGSQGEHVPATPFWWPSYRVLRKRIKSRVSRAIGGVIKGMRNAG